MAEEDPSYPVAALIIPRPAAGHRRFVQVDHPMCGSGNLLTTDASWSEAQQPNYVNYALNPITTPQRPGPKQRALHTEGPNEITWSVNGELTNNTMGLLGLMSSNSRGINFSKVLISQGSDDTYTFFNNNGFSLPWSNFSVSGSQNGAVTFTLEGKSTFKPALGGFGTAPFFPDVPVPSWFTGNDFVTAWSLAHSVNLTPNWVNTISPYPAYYRPGHSEFTIQVTMKAALREHSTIRFGFGEITLIEALVTSRNRTFGGRNEPVTYQVTTTNVRVSDQNVYNPSIYINILGGPDTAAVF